MPSAGTLPATTGRPHPRPSGHPRRPAAPSRRPTPPCASRPTTRTVTRVRTCTPGQAARPRARADHPLSPSARCPAPPRPDPSAQCPPPLPPLLPPLPGPQRPRPARPRPDSPAPGAPEPRARPMGSTRCARCERTWGCPPPAASGSWAQPAGRWRPAPEQRGRGAPWRPHGGARGARLGWG